jgi:hypothetical protein
MWYGKLHHGSPWHKPEELLTRMRICISGSDYLCGFSPAADLSLSAYGHLLPRCSEFHRQWWKFWEPIRLLQLRFLSEVDKLLSPKTRGKVRGFESG